MLTKANIPRIHANIKFCKLDIKIDYSSRERDKCDI